MGSHSVLTGRGVLAIGGADRVSFLQGLVSNDVAAARHDAAVFAAFLTAQGKFLHDFNVVDADGRLLLEMDRTRLPDLQRRLKLYKLRSDVTLEDQSARWAVHVVFGADEATALAPDGQIRFRDPRHPALGLRMLVPVDTAADAVGSAGAQTVDEDAWQRHRIGLGIPDGAVDLLPEKSTLIESNYDLLNGVSWDKGCYMGQELTARMHYRGLAKKRLVGVRYAGPAPAFGTDLLRDGRAVGEMRGGTDGAGIALVRLDAMTGPTLAADNDGRPVTVAVPDWLRQALPAADPAVSTPAVSA